MIRRYLERKVLANAMDYDDLLLNWKRLLETHPEVRTALALRFRSVLVDEFQDVNHLQAEIVDLLAKDSEQRNVMVVGDDAQSIYSFRGADAEALLGFPDRYPGAAIYRLETNYRSTPEILRLADASIAHNARRYEKTLVADARVGRPGRRRRRAGPGAAGRVRRAAGPRAARRGDAALRDRRPLPRALPGAGAADRADPPRHPVRGPLGPALLRAGARQGRPRPPAAPREPEGRDVVQAGAQAPAEGGGADGGGPLGGRLRGARAARRLPRPRAGKGAGRSACRASCASARR